MFGWLGFEFCDEIEDEITRTKDVKDLEKDPKTELISSFIDVYRWLQRWKYNKDRFNRVCNRVCFHVSLFPLIPFNVFDRATGCFLRVTINDGFFHEDSGTWPQQPLPKFHQENELEDMCGTLLHGGSVQHKPSTTAAFYHSTNLFVQHHQCAHLVAVSTGRLPR